MSELKAQGSEVMEELVSHFKALGLSFVKGGKTQSLFGVWVDAVGEGGGCACSLRKAFYMDGGGGIFGYKKCYVCGTKKKKRLKILRLLACLHNSNFRLRTFLQSPKI
jgi:hypothetical protein